jgi:hypothetical protein
VPCLEQGTAVAFTGFLELQTPADLFCKLEHDFLRLEKDPLNSYAAFDFFVTAEHMLDWVYPNDEQKKKAERQSDPLLETCSHLANGAKHFQVTHKKHQSVAGTQLHRGSFSNGFSRGFDISMLEVHLKGNAEAKLGSVVEVTDLSRMVLDYLRKRLGL